MSRHRQCVWGGGEAHPIMPHCPLAREWQLSGDAGHHEEAPAAGMRQKLREAAAHSRSKCALPDWGETGVISAKGAAALAATRAAALAAAAQHMQ